MKANLYIDTSEHLIIGLLDQDFQWIEYLDTNERKGSGVIHGLIHEMLKRAQVSMDDIQDIFMLSGPGSYTGMRLGEGVAQVLEMEGRKIYSTYHFDLPALTGVKSGAWLSKAFKGELFIHHWNGEEENQALISEEDLQQKITELGVENSCYTHVPEGIFEGFKSTVEIMKENVSTLCSHLKEKDIRKDPYYYRPLEKEFKATGV